METTRPAYVYPGSPLYTQAQYDAVARLYLDGDAGYDAAAEVGMERRAAYRFLERNGLTRPRNATRYSRIPEEARAVAPMKRTGSSADEIAAFLGVSRTTAYRRLRLASLAP